MPVLQILLCGGCLLGAAAFAAEFEFDMTLRAVPGEREQLGKVSVFRGPPRLCDYASAGAPGTRYRSWLPAVK